MSSPFDGAQTFLTSVSNLVRQVYHDRFEDMYEEFTRINKLFRPTKTPIDGDGWNIQVRSSNMHAARTNTDLNADFGTPRAYGVDTYKITLSETPSSNDVRRLDLSLQKTWLDAHRAYTKKVSPESYSEALISQANQDIDASMARHRYMSVDSKLGDVNGTPKKNDRETYSACAAIATTGGARVQVDGGSLANFAAGMYLDRYTSNTLDGQVYITDVNPSDQSVGMLALNAQGNPDSTVNMNDIADNDSFYATGEKDKGLKSFGYWFSTPAASESFFGRDRTSTTYRWLNPTRTGPSAERQFVKTDIDDLAISLSYVIGDSPMGAYLAIMTPELSQRYRNEIGNDVLIQFPSTEQKGDLIAQYGFDGELYRHPRLGRIVFEVDPLALPNKIRFLRVGDWEMFSPRGADQFTWLPGDNTGGNWYRMESSTPGNGKTTTIRMDGFLALADGCFLPRRQAEINNVRATV